MNSPIEALKQQFPHSGAVVHMNNAGQAPLSAPAYAALLEWSEIFRTQGANAYYQALPLLEDARRNISLFFGCSDQELAFVQSAAWAISQVAFGLKLSPNDEIIIWDQEYPSNFYPWREAAKRTGAKLIVLKSPSDLSTPLDVIESHITARTKVIATSWVQFKSGAQTDLFALGKLAKSHGIFTCVDVIQGVGCLPFHFREMGIDAACGAGHKWLASGHGTGYLMLREEHLDKITPLAVGALSYTGDKVTYSDTLEPSARRFEPGGKPFSDIFALAATVDLFSRTGMQRIHAEAEKLTRKLKDGFESLGYQIFSPHGEKFKGAILNVMPSAKSPLKSLSEMTTALTSAHITHAPRQGGVRLSPHAFTMDKDIDKVLRACK